METPDLPADPMKLFSEWLQDALLHQVQEPYAMTVATVDSEAMPHVRVVYLREVLEEGFVFYTNYRSNKAQQLLENPKVALKLHWPERDHQIRINGLAEKAPEELSDAYFEGRARESQLGAWASPQSSAIENRDWLISELESVRKRFEGKKVTRPPHWGGFLIRPLRIEFWTGHSARLHDRFVFIFENERWQKQRLAP
ncbi:MAG: pyridoxamine 5'-phosphate oxidase [Salibacteraceae bacterium]